MHDHAKPAVPDFNLDHIILNCETSDLNFERAASQIAKSIIKFKLSLKSQDKNIDIPYCAKG